MRSVYERAAPLGRKDDITHLVPEYIAGSDPSSPPITITVCGLPVEGMEETGEIPYFSCEKCYRIPVGTVQRPVVITMQQIIDVSVTALEGGIGYWSQLNDRFKGYQTEGTFVLSPNDGEDEDDPETWEQGDHIQTWSEFIHGQRGLSQRPNVNLDSRTIEVTPQLLLEGIEMWLQVPKRDLDDIDASDADCIVQYALFGEVVFA